MLTLTFKAFPHCLGPVRSQQASTVTICGVQQLNSQKHWPLAKREAGGKKLNFYFAAIITTI